MKFNYSIGAAIVLPTMLLTTSPSRSAGPQNHFDQQSLTKQLANLKQQRLKTAQRINHDHQLAFEAETISVDQLIGPMSKLTEAERAVATTPQAELGVLEESVRRFKRLYEKLYPPRENEMGERNDYPSLRLEIESAEITVLEFRLRAKL